MFSIEQLISIIGVVVPLVAVYFGIKSKLDKLIAQNQSLVGLREANEENTRALKQLAHYVRWLAKTQTDEEPPPPMDSL